MDPVLRRGCAQPPRRPAQAHLLRSARDTPGDPQAASRDLRDVARAARSTETVHRQPRPNRAGENPALRGKRESHRQASALRGTKARGRLRITGAPACDCPSRGGGRTSPERWQSDPQTGVAPGGTRGRKVRSKCR